MKLLSRATMHALTSLLTACSMFDDSVDAGAAAPASLPAAEAPSGTPVPQRASGVYNSSTGRIEWQTSDGPPMATPAPRKRWWLF